MLKNSVSILMLFLLTASALVADFKPCFASYVHFYNGEYLLSTPEARVRPNRILPAAEGKTLLERLLDPAHMAVTGFGEAANATLRAGDDTKGAAFALLGPAKRLPDWRKCELAYGYVSARPGDSTMVLMDMSDPCMDNDEYVAAFRVCFSQSVLPKEYRQHIKRFVPTKGVHAGLATQSGLRLGLTREEVETVLGKPLWKEKDTYYYGALGDVHFTPELLIARWKWPKDVEAKRGGDDHRITVWFVGGRVSAFEVRKLYDF